MLNEVPNRNDATGIVNDVCLTTTGKERFSMAAVYIVISIGNRMYLRAIKE